MFEVKKYIKKYRLIKFLLLVIPEIIFFSTINPYSSQTIVLVIGVTFVVVDYYLLVNYIVSYLAKIYKVIFNQKKRIVLFLTVIGSLFIILKSLGQLSINDVLVIILLSIIGYSYSWYASDQKKRIKKNF